MLRFRARRILCSATPLPGMGSTTAKQGPVPRRFTRVSLFIDDAGSDCGFSTGDLVLFAGDYAPQTLTFADGSSRRTADWPALYTVLYGAGPYPSGSLFSLPEITQEWPVGAFSGGHGRWLVATYGVWPADCGTQSGLPGQVYFTAISPTLYGSYFSDMACAGVTDPGIGTPLGTAAQSYLLPAGWPDYAGASDYAPLIGELRLFKTGTALPYEWLPADGRWMDVGCCDPLDAVLCGAYGNDTNWVVWGSYRLPDVAAPEGYEWAIAAWGSWPTR